MKFLTQRVDLRRKVTQTTNKLVVDFRFERCSEQPSLAKFCLSGTAHMSLRDESRRYESCTVLRVERFFVAGSSLFRKMA